MIAKFRWVLICMIVLALPVQGIAAATMRFCAPGPDAQALHGAAMPAHHHAAHAPASAAVHQHHEPEMADVADDESKAGLATSKMKCSACAVCCMAAAVAPATPTVHAIEAASTIALPAPVSYAGPVADGLERPPRPLLA